ncbi:transporter substrate-binding domain-containing protein [Thalassospira lucentensis]|uniref:substrate-binding periplasmic protein n=1 Tax=Thalassospira lucentensis TaxID=168935 RepID=UPI002942B934|nr:transporter substrate-binding domain-containing protein [Thalassospira lucentensis]WOI09391.1 transporter substrate-binding domain-containing protein [Thalassospira lucentensis]
MKKQWVMMLVLTASLMMATQAKADHVRIVTGDYFAPFTGRDLPDGGIMTEIVRRAFEIAGYDHAEIIWRSWRQGYDMTVRGEVEGTFPYAYTPFRARSVLFSEPVASLSAFGWYAKSRQNFETIDDLNGAALCLPLGYAELGRTSQMLATGRATRHAPPDMRTCFKLLGAGRVDIVVAPRSEARDSMRAAGLELGHFGHIDEPLSTMPLHFVIGLNHPRAGKIMQDFNTALRELDESGELAVLLSRAQY